jgi:hypothetical protein
MMSFQACTGTVIDINGIGAGEQPQQTHELKLPMVPSPTIPLP